MCTNTSKTIVQQRERPGIISRSVTNDHRRRINPGTRVIAIPSESGSLQWKTPSECIWDDSEFSQNGLQLQSKIAMRQITEQHDISVAMFFTSVVGLQNAGISELLDDLALMQQDGSDDTATVFRLYERIEVYRRSSTDQIKCAPRN